MNKFPEQRSKELLELYRSGDQSVLNELLQLNEKFIYNLSWKFIADPNDAMDLTQEVLIKVVKSLDSFKGNSSFQTWLYRITMNEFLQTKRRKMEDKWVDFDDFKEKLNQIPSPELSVEEEMEQKYRTQTARNRCMSGMLMCLTREQRLLYIVGDVYGIDHNIGSEIFGLSKDNYRKKLSRTRKEFHAFINSQCGLVNKDNPCRCSKKAKAMEAAGRMKTDEKLFDPGYYSKISEYANTIADEVADTVDRKYLEFFQDHPSREDFTKESVIKRIVEDSELHKYF